MTTPEVREVLERVEAGGVSYSWAPDAVTLAAAYRDLEVENARLVARLYLKDDQRQNAVDVCDATRARLAEAMETIDVIRGLLEEVGDSYTTDQVWPLWNHALNRARAFLASHGREKE